MKIERKIQHSGYTNKRWKEIRRRVKKWWQEDLNAIEPRRKVSRGEIVMQKYQ
jgi:hypothetical protein